MPTMHESRSFKTIVKLFPSWWNPPLGDEELIRIFDNVSMHKTVPLTNVCKQYSYFVLFTSKLAPWMKSWN